MSTRRVLITMSAATVRKLSNDNVKKDMSVEISLCLGVFVLILLKCCRTGVGQRKLVLTLLSTITPDNYREDDDSDNDDIEMCFIFGDKTGDGKILFGRTIPYQLT